MSISIENNINENKWQNKSLAFGQTVKSSQPKPRHQNKADSFEKQGDGRFTAGEAAKNFAKGLISPIVALVKHPMMTIGTVAATIGVCSLIPVLTPVLTIGFGALSLFEMAKGGAKAIKEYQNGNADASEKAFQEIGSGFVGTVLTLLGLKASARVAVEAKATQATGQALSTEKSAEIAQKVKADGLFSALKEHFTLFSTKEGRSSIIAQFKPKAIKQRFDKYKEFMKKSSEPKTYEKAFKETVEGKRRANLGVADYQQEIFNIADKAFEQMGIPKELRPKIVIEDELKCFSKPEIEEKVATFIKDRHSLVDKDAKITIFAEADDPMKMTDEQLVAKIKNAVDNFKDNKLSVSDSDYQLLLNKPSGGNGGSYTSETHTVVFNAGGYKQGYMNSFEEILVHEIAHSKKAILRSRLDDAERAEVVKDLLIQRIKQGEAEEIVKKPNILGPDMMKPPKMSSQAREQYAEFAQEYLYKSDNTLYNALINREKFNRPNTNAASRNLVDAANQKLAPIIDKLKQIANDSPEFISQNGGSEEKAVEKLLEYTLAQEVRYTSFSRTEVAAVKDLKLPPLTAEEKAEALASLSEQMETIDGNSRISGLKGMFASGKAFNQYQFSAEEVFARNTAANYEKVELLQKQELLKNEGKLTAEKKIEIDVRIKLIDFQLEYNATGEKYYQAYMKLANNPNDVALKAEFEKLDAAMIKLEKKKTDYAVAGIKMPFIPADLKVTYPLNTLPRHSSDK